MAFRLMRYATAAMQHHLDAGHKTLPLVIPMLFYHGQQSPYPGRSTGWMNLIIRNWRANCIQRLFRWSTLP